MDAFGTELSFDEENARAAHEEMCRSVERETGIERALTTGGHPPAAA